MHGGIVCALYIICMHASVDHNYYCGFNGFHHTAIITAQLTVLTRPEALVSSSGSVVEGSVIQIYCTVEDYTTVTFIWTLNGSSLLNDPPHIRIREDNLPERSVSLLTDDSTSVLTVDNTRASDDGVYQCTATSGANSGNGTAVTLTGVHELLESTIQPVICYSCVLYC